MVNSDFRCIVCLDLAPEDRNVETVIDHVDWCNDISWLLLDVVGGLAEPLRVRSGLVHSGLLLG